MQHSKVTTETPSYEGGDRYTPYQYWGVDFGDTAANTIRTLTDGEQHTGVTDLDGIWTDGEPAYLFNPIQASVNTDCKFIAPNLELKVGEPGLKVCPLTTATASMALRAEFDGSGQGDIHPTLGRQFYIKTFPLSDEEPIMDELTPVRLMSNSDNLKGHYYHTVEAYKVHKMWWENSRPQTSLHYHVQEADRNSWFRFSLCIGKGTAISFIQAKVANFGNDLAEQGWPNRTITGLNSLDELNAQAGDNWYHDTAKGWLHVKLVQSEDRTIGGDILDRTTGDRKNNKN